MEAPKIFKAYDIRGVYGTELDEGIGYLVGRAVASKLIIEKPGTGRIRKVLVGRDMRVSSVPLRDALVKGIRDQGIDVVDVGFVSSPMFYWASQKYEAGVMVTASHNPAKYNGFKICKDGAFPVGEISGMKEIEATVMAQDFAPSEGEGSYEEQSLIEEYLAFSLSFLKTTKEFKVVVDAGNGMGGYIYGELLKRKPANLEIIPMYFEPDGTFPNHEANPLKPETCKGLQARVIAEGADLGVALDGDEDRVFFVDDRGRYLVADYPSALIAEQVLSEKPGSKILYGINQSRIVPETIRKSGGVPVLNRVGHAFYKVSMAKEHAAWGAEHSGHYFNPEQQNTENTLIVFFRLLNLLGHEGKRLSELVDPLHKYEKIDETNFDVSDPKGVMAALQQEYGPRAQEVTTIDGLRLDFADWWFCVRPSNTEPLLRLNMECEDKAMLDEKFKELSLKIGGKIHH